MSYSVVFRIIGGSFEEGYEIEAEIRHNRRIICTELGRLPPQPEIPKLYEQTFPTHYANWGGRSQWGAKTMDSDDGDAVEAVKACVDTSKQLEQIFQTWFRQADLEDIQTRIVREIPHGSEPIFILLESGRDFEGMVVVTPRHPDLPFASTFSRTFRQIFGLQPNWREMTSYDAVKSIAVGLQQSDGTRAGLQQKLHDPKFTIPDGSSGPIKFSQSGDRLVTPSIAQVQCQASQCKFGLIPAVAPRLTPTP
jgi:hypothetical protein